jgi:actin related protein 2/3 complex subunit 1A/1B
LANTITCHAWNADGTRVALCPNNNEIHIYAKSGNGYTLEHKLTEHDQVVTGIDWAPKSNRIVSCSQDRNAYVWTFKDNKWKPVLVILRINRAATDVKWSPDENKFAVASGAKCVSVCYFEEDNDWWVSKHIKKHRSTVLKVAWHPSSVLIATASTDFKARVFSAAIKGVDKGAPNTPFGSKIGFGELLAEVDSLGWVQSVKWSPSGNKLAFVAQDSTLTVADVSSGQASVETVKHRALPFRDLTWANETSIIVVGHDNNPTLFQNQGGWKLIKKLDTSAGAGAGAGAAAAAKGPSAFSVFQNKVDKGETATETKLDTKHQNCITAIVPYKVQAGNLVQYSTTSVDGQLLLWDAPK